MSKIGRNERCPCGSGRKYKACCLSVTSGADSHFQSFRQMHESLIPQLLAFVYSEFGRELLEEAWPDFTDHEMTGEIDPDGPMAMLFMPWFLFNWSSGLRPPGKMTLQDDFTLVELFLIANDDRLTPEEKSFLKSLIGCPFTFCEVVKSEIGVGMRLRDLLRQVEYDVVERAASRLIKRGEIIFCSTSEYRGFRSNEATGPYALRPTAKHVVNDMREWIVTEADSKKLTAEHLHDFEFDIRDLYLDCVKEMLVPPTLVNTDGDPIAVQELYFEIESADEAFHKLKGLAEGVSERELLRDAERADGSVVKAHIPWLGGSEKAKRIRGGPIVLGEIKIEGRRLIAEVNSGKRAELFKEIIGDALGHSAKFTNAIIDPLEYSANEGLKPAGSRDGGSPKPGQFDEISRELLKNPGIRAEIEGIARNHWAAWFDEPIPALSDMSPRNAAKTKKGRELLESLLLLYENRADPNDLFSPNIRDLRRQLKMD